MNVIYKYGNALFYLVSYRALRKPETLIGFIIAVAGADLALMSSKIPPWVGLVSLAIGILIILHSLGILSLRELKTSMIASREKERGRKQTISRVLIGRLTLNGRFLPLLPAIGILILAIVLSYNIISSPNRSVGSYDLISLMFGITLIIYPLIHDRYPKESDFLLVFFAIMTVEIIVAFMILGPEPTTTESVTGDLYVRYMLVLPLVAMLNISGINAEAVGSAISFTTQDGQDSFVGIAISCSGIYSAMIFLAAFFAYVLSFFYRWERKTAILLAIGTAAAYFANLLRMYLVVTAGYFNGMGNSNDPAIFTLNWTHKYAGEVIFICWIALFWWLAFRYFTPEEEEYVSERTVEEIQEQASTDSESENSDLDDS